MREGTRRRRAVGRSALGAALLAALVAAVGACGGSQPLVEEAPAAVTQPAPAALAAVVAASADATPPAPEPVVVAPDPAAADRATIVGATDAEREAARAALAAVPDLDVTQLVFFDDGDAPGGRRALRVMTPTAIDTADADPLDYWRVGLLAEVIARPLEAGRRPIRWLELEPGGGGRAFDPGAQAARSGDELAALARAIGARAAAGGWPVRELRVWPAGRGGVAVTLRLTERGLLDGPTDWGGILGDEPSTFAHLLVVEAPDGTRLSFGGSFGPTGGFGRSEPYVPIGTGPAPADLAGPTRLVVDAERHGPDRGRVQRSTTTIDCARPDGELAVVCARIVGDRYSLFAPIESGAVCSGVQDADGVSVSGTVLGVDVRRDYGGCYPLSAGRWLDLLAALPPGLTVVHPEPGPGGTTLVGATPSEWRSVRAVLRLVGRDLAGATLRFEPHRRTRALVLELPTRPNARRGWLTTLVVREIARRQLQTKQPIRWLVTPSHGGGAYVRDGWAPRGPKALRALARAVRAETVAHGFRASVETWPLGAGAVALTVRLTERQLLEGRTDWTGPTFDRRRFSGLLQVTAPDGTVVQAFGNMGRASGFSSYDAEDPRSNPPAPGFAGRTLLRLRVTSPPRATRSLTLDCDGSGSRGIQRLRSVCARVLRERYALFVPSASAGGGCLAGASRVQVDGSYLGVRVVRDFGACSTGTSARWLRVLGLDAP